MPIASLRHCRRPGHRSIALAFCPHRNFHLADALDAAPQVIAVGELRDARRRSRRDQDSGLERHHVREKANVLAKAADHVAGMRAHGELAVLLDADREVLRIVDLVARHDPRSEAGEGVEAFADVARVLRSEEHTSELQSRSDLVCRLLLEKKKKQQNYHRSLKKKTKQIE